ncbi:MAG: chitobiase/beta-hexosaminidase C-terminal domain-containing protein, partial [Lachnospiraceae bacterium]|nr:chitobiase/beta-hexosaminidase C-terminal domain-containing protein [Lachnospiraceae bacterium]
HQASVLDQKARFEEAVLYYEEAIQQKETVDAYINLGNDLVLLQRMDKAEDAYRKALALAKSRGEDTLAAYDALLTLFEETGDAEAASVLYDEISKKRLKTNLAAKFVRPPSFSQPGGTYDSDVYLELTSEEDYVIYYTKDGSEPAYNGKEYTKPIRIKGGETMVKACCVDTAGKASMVIQETYTVDYPVPAMPRANPSGGTFHSPIQIVLSKESEGEIYYSWNGSIPTKKSGTRYTGPIWIPEGNNVLSAVVIDDNKMSSDVLRCNYIYLP